MKIEKPCHLRKLFLPPAKRSQIEIEDVTGNIITNRRGKACLLQGAG
ncbi:hypothetical protein Daudx_1712 [Candidatus Desulforudis audaxviator]|nr:hypothetical protein Daudx_1712 [Candidatus Desulforudis audaxviator]